MRIMINENGHKLKVLEHIILKNFWEYYVIDSPTNEGSIYQCYVMGFENELGDVDLNEIKPFIITRTKKLNEVACASGFSWEDASDE